MARKLGKATDQRMAMLKNQVSNLLWYGKIETTLYRAKEVASITEKLLTLAINNYNDKVTVTKEVTNQKGEKVQQTFENDGAKKLAARRRLMAELYDLQEIKTKDESKSEYKKRTKDIKHPLIEKLFNEYAPKYAARIEKNGMGGGYTKIVKTGVRNGDACEMAIITLL